MLSNKLVAFTDNIPTSFGPAIRKTPQKEPVKSPSENFEQLCWNDPSNPVDNRPEALDPIPVSEFGVEEEYIQSLKSRPVAEADEFENLFNFLDEEWPVDATLGSDVSVP